VKIARLTGCKNLKRDQVVKIARLTGCKNFEGERERSILNMFVVLNSTVKAKSHEKLS